MYCNVTTTSFVVLRLFVHTFLAPNSINAIGILRGLQFYNRKFLKILFGPLQKFLSHGPPMVVAVALLIVMFTSVVRTSTAYCSSLFVIVIENLIKNKTMRIITRMPNAMHL